VFYSSSGTCLLFILCPVIVPAVIAGFIFLEGPTSNAAVSGSFGETKIFWRNPYA
jgi:hypothetical protein